MGQKGNTRQGGTSFQQTSPIDTMSNSRTWTKHSSKRIRYYAQRLHKNPQGSSVVQFRGSKQSFRGNSRAQEITPGQSLNKVASERSEMKSKSQLEGANNLARSQSRDRNTTMSKR